MIQVTGLTKHIVDGNATKAILTNLDFQLSQAQSAAISGDSGSGKSTFLNILAALDNADSGSIEVAGVDLAKVTTSQADKFRKQQIGIVFQQFNLIDCLSVWDNITFPARLNGQVIDSYHLRLLDNLGLTSHKHKLPMNLSGGEQQRVAIARALSHKPKLVLADEPTGNLDDKNSQIVSELIFSLCKKLGITLVLVTHSPKVAAWADHQFRLQQGNLHLQHNSIADAPLTQHAQV